MASETSVPKRCHACFLGCDNLATIISYRRVPPPCYKETFGSSLPTNAQLYVPKGCKDAYAQYAGWALFEIIEMDE